MGLGAPELADYSGVRGGTVGPTGGMTSVGTFSSFNDLDGLHNAMHQVTTVGAGVPGGYPGSCEDLVKEVLADERQYLRDLLMITRLFRDVVVRNKLHTDMDELEAIFSNIHDITELTNALIGQLEDTLEMNEQGNDPAIGTCFYELAEAEEFAVYEKFIADVLSPHFRTSLNALLSRPESQRAMTAEGQNTLQSDTAYREAFKYYLPTLLLKAVYHCSSYFKCIEVIAVDMCVLEISVNASRRVLTLQSFLPFRT